jgi:transcriptional regulator with XRE-family HTH domain
LRAISPSSSLQRAGQELAERLREIRLGAGLTARALSVAAGWHEAKTSRIETAQQALSDANIQSWCQVCGVSRQAPDLIAASRARLDVRHMAAAIPHRAAAYPGIPAWSFSAVLARPRAAKALFGMPQNGPRLGLAACCAVTVCCPRRDDALSRRAPL